MDQTVKILFLLTTQEPLGLSNFKTIFEFLKLNKNGFALFLFDKGNDNAF